MRKFFMLFLVLIISLVFSGCTPPDDIIINDREEYFEEGANKVTMWVNDFEEWNNQLNIKQRMDFNDFEDDEIQLEQVFVEVSSFEDLIRSARETNSVPDIYMVSYGNLYKEVVNNYATDLTSYFDTIIWDDLTDNADAAVTYNNSKYAFPILMEPSTMLFYRKDLLLQYGNTNEVPTNWDDFLVLLETIRTNIQDEGVRGLYPFDVPKGVALGWATWGLQIEASGGLAISDDWTTSRLNEPGYQNLAELWDNLYANNLVPLSSGDYTEVINDLCLDKLVFTTAGSWSISTIINDYPELVDQIGVIPMPTFGDNQDVTTATNGGWAYVISSESTNKEAAAEVIKYLVAENIDKPVEYFEGAKFSKSPTRKSVQTEIQLMLDNQTEVPSEWINTLIEVSNKSELEPIYSWDISIAISRMLENAALGNNIATEIKNASDEITAIINRENLGNNNPRGD